MKGMLGENLPGLRQLWVKETYAPEESIDQMTWGNFWAGAVPGLLLAALIVVAKKVLSPAPRIVQELQVGASAHLVSPVPTVPITWQRGT